MGKQIRVLLVEDSPDDAELAIRELKRAGYEPEYERVDSPEAMKEALEREWDIILSDHEMPRFSAPDALRLLKETGRDIPFIILSGAITVELAGEVMRAGGRDFIPKNRLSLLGPAIDRELEEFHTRREKMRAEEELEKAEAKYRDLYENAPDMFFSVDAETRRVTDCNEMAVRLTGFSRDEIIGHLVFERYHPDCIEEIKTKWFPLFQRTGEIHNAELQMRTKDGGKMYVLLNMAGVYDENEKLLYSRSVCRDITERKQAKEALRESELRMRAIFENALDGILLADTETRQFLTGNNAACRMLGYSLEALQNMKIDDIHPKETLPDVLARIKKHAENKTTLAEEVPVKRKDGTVFYADINASSLRLKGKICSLAFIRDVTERKEAEEELASSREKFEKITSSMQDAVILINAEGSVVYWNPAAEKIFGYSMEEMTGRNIHSLITPARYLDAAEKGFSKFTKSGEGALIGKVTELFGLRKDGEEFPLELSISSMRFRKQYHAVGIVRDITERKKAERDIYESSRLLEESQKVANLGTYNLDISSGIWSSSNILDRIFGITDPEFIRDVEGWLKIVHPEQREEMQSYLTNHVLAERNRFDKEYRIIRLDDKQERWVHGLGELVLDENQNPIKMIGTIQDVTERKKVEAERNRLSVGIEQAGEAIVMTDVDANIIYVNPQFEKNTGYSREEAIGKHMRILKSGKQDEAFYKNLWAVIPAGKVWKGCFVNRRKDGSLFDEEATISPVFNDKGEIINYVAVKRDITETAMLERSRKHFTTITSHELKTPQVKLQLGIERLKLLQRGEFDRERFDEALKALEDTEHDFSHIITGALLLAELSEPVMPNMMEENYIFSHIESAVYKTRSLMAKEKRNVEIELDLSRLSARTAVYGNRKMISRAIEEILSNAVKYTPDGKKVTVTARAEEKKAVILIADEGPGVPEAKKKVALDAYSSLENTLHHSTGRYLYEGGGLGLGLTLARLIMDHHHGRMEICSGGTESGTTVVLSFPTIGKKNSGTD